MLISTTILFGGWFSVISIINEYTESRKPPSVGPSWAQYTTFYRLLTKNCLRFEKVVHRLLVTISIDDCTQFSLITNRFTYFCNIGQTDNIQSKTLRFF